MAGESPSYEELLESLRLLQAENAHLKARLAELEEKLREAHRQAAPFRRRESRKKSPIQNKKPFRKRGQPGGYRQAPEGDFQEIEVPLAGCPHCQCELTDLRRREQYIEEIPAMPPERTKLTTWTGVCPQCGPVASRHPLQTSTAVGAAGTHLGPRAQALAVLLAHRSGLTMSRVCQVLHDLCGLRLSRGGLAQLLRRAAGRLEPLHGEILRTIRNSAAVFADETGWYVGEPRWWLWVFTTPFATLYRVEKCRGAEVVSDTLGANFEGMLVSDCLASYNPIACRKHKCISHHLQALKEQEEALQKRGVKSHDLLLWKVLLGDVCETWKRREAMGPVAYDLKVQQLSRGVENLLGRAPPEPEALAFHNRMARQRQHLLGCLEEPAAEPTNNRAERDLRPAVISRKLSCGNRTPSGAHTWEVLRSVTVTLSKQGKDLVAALTPAFRLALP